MPAQAKRPDRMKGIWGPTRIDGVSQFPRYRDLGVGIFNIQLVWNRAAPSQPANPRDPADPAYTWPADLDFALREARAQGIRVSLLVRATPSWANGGAGPNVRPTRPGDYAAFLSAAAKRYPTVRLWQTWGEPNGGAYQWLPRTGAPFRSTLNRAQQVAPRDYAKLLDAAYGALKAANRRNVVVGGMTMMGGDITPAAWIRYMVLPGGKRPRMDMYGHNPFMAARRPRTEAKPPKPGWRDLSNLGLLARDLDRWFKGRRLRLYLSEWSVWSDVKGPANWFVSRATQARWLRDGYRIARRNKRVYSLGWFRLHDTPARGSLGPTGFGLLDVNNQPKPAYEAFRDA